MSARLVVVDRDYKRVKRALNVTTNVALAESLGFHRATIIDIHKGGRQPSAEFIATVLASTGLQFTDVFAIRTRRASS